MPRQWDRTDIMLIKPRPRSPSGPRGVLGQLPATSPAEWRCPLRARSLSLAPRTNTSPAWAGCPASTPPNCPSGRVFVPLYSDGYSFSMMAFTDDGGAHLEATEPIVGPGNVQPSIVRRQTERWLAFFRDNGPPPKRVGRRRVARRRRDVDPRPRHRPADPGSGFDVLALRDGRWFLILNDTEPGRHRLSLAPHDDEGRTWPEVVPRLGT